MTRSKPLFICVASLISFVCLLASMHAQEKAPMAELEWKMLNEMSGLMRGYPGFTMNVYGAQIARAGDRVKLAVRVEFPNGSPRGMFQKNVPSGVDPGTIAQVVGRLELDCGKMSVKPSGGSAEIFQQNGNHFKSKEPSFKIASAGLLATYFCEQGEAPTTAPVLKETKRP